MEMTIHKDRIPRRIAPAILFGLLINDANNVLAAEPCADFEPERRAYFGDTHVHTSYSQDANWRMGLSQTTPDDAYRFAKGEEIYLPPFDEQGNSVRSLRIQRALDFAIVTDHAENMSSVRLCDDPDSESNTSWSCRRGPFAQAAAKFAHKLLPDSMNLCLEDTPECTAAKLAVWNDTIHAAQSHNQPCEFTSFIGYEWSGMLGRSNMHRNVVFKSASVLGSPISALDEKTIEGLWKRLDVECDGANNGCQALTIPHNANLSQGKMFSPMMSDGHLMDRENAVRRAQYERLAEIVQHKGSSECYYQQTLNASLLLKDELCDFELLPYSDFFGKYFTPIRKPPENDNRYLRSGLREGLRLGQTLGTNPFKVGFIGSTDTHIGAAGAVEENNYKGNHGAQSIMGKGDQPQLPDRVEQNPGGLAGLYAEQNSRDSLFAAMHRREAFATSGTRIKLRFFGGWDYPDDMCQRSDMVRIGYQQGVPMGGILAAEKGDDSPVFVIAAIQDAGAERLRGTPLQRLQIVKVWIDERGMSRESVIDVAGNKNNGASVDLQSCKPTGVGFNELCTVWKDTAFNAKEQAYYYARAIENPSCRWQQHICAFNKVDCSSSEEVPEGLKNCCDTSVPATIQERAWSSPIWYQNAIN